MGTQQLTSFDLATATHSAMKFLALSVILALAVTLSSGFSVEHALHQEWSLFKITHGKTYAAAEEELHDDLSAEPRHDPRPQRPLQKGRSLLQHENEPVR